MRANIKSVIENLKKSWDVDVVMCPVFGYRCNVTRGVREMPTISSEPWSAQKWDELMMNEFSTLETQE